MIRQLGQWEFDVSERLGGGGYADAYRCRSPDARLRECAIKVFNDPYHANTFKDEVAALAKMAACSGTPSLIDYGRDRLGRLCIVTELARGQRLDKWIKRRGTLKHEQAVELIRALLVLLEHAHGQGLLHKDIKTSNLLYDGTHFSLLDWGVAEPIGNGHAESIRAKQDYVAPECYYGRHGKATDFYSLGWLLVEVLSGSRPYHFADNREREYRVAAHCLERPELPESIPGIWRPLILSWINKTAERRAIDYDMNNLLSARLDVSDDACQGMLDYRCIGMMQSALEQAAQAGIPYAQHELSLKLIKAGHATEAMHWLDLAATSNYGKSAYKLARLMETDAHCAADPSRVQALLFSAATLGNAQAQYRLAVSALHRNDHDQGQHWLALAAENGNSQAQYAYGRLKEQQTGLSVSAVRYYGMAADRGHEKAQQRLVRLRVEHANAPALSDMVFFWAGQSA